MTRHAIVIRSGGLGDFVLTLPLLRALRASACRVTLVTRKLYARLIVDDGLYDAWLDIDDLDFGTLFVEPNPRLRELIAGSDVFCFLPDSDGTLGRVLDRLDPASVAWLTSRPTVPPHVTHQMLRDAGQSVPCDLYCHSVLARAETPVGPCLWLHPGSGSSRKNASVEWFAQRARAWYATHHGRVVVSFGEADMALPGQITQHLRGIPWEAAVLPSLHDLRRQLAHCVTQFIGNDSGVTHLAAALGVPTEAVFRATQPAIWRPLGHQVHVLHWMEEGGSFRVTVCDDATVYV